MKVVLNCSNIIKYAIFTAIIYTLFNYVPERKLATTDVMVMTSVALICFIICNHVLDSKTNEGFENGEEPEIPEEPEVIVVEKPRKMNSNGNGKKTNGKKEKCDCAKYVEEHEPHEMEVAYEEETSKTKMDELVQVMKRSGLTLDVDGRIVKKEPSEGPTTAQQAMFDHIKIAQKTDENQMGYSEYPEEMHRPLGEYDKTFTNKFDHGFSYLSTDKWRIPVRRPPVCIQEKKCPVCPVQTPGYPLDVKQWNESRRIHQNDILNLEYIRDQLNREDK